MDNKLTNGRPLTEDEKGQLHGGFSLQKSTFRTRFFSDNGNCKGGGWFDDNVNCSRCSGCDKHKGMDTDTDDSDEEGGQDNGGN